MFKSSRWRGVAGAGDKGKSKVVFKLLFHATQVGAEGNGIMVVLMPADAGRPTARTEKSAVNNGGGGSCRWPSPVYETVKFSKDAKYGRFLDKIYSVLLYETGSAKPALIGEASMNMADYAEAVKPCSVTLRLRGSKGVLLHVTIQKMVGAGGDDGSFKQDSDNCDPATAASPKPHRRTLQSQLSSCDDDEQDGTAAQRHLAAKIPSSRDMPLNAGSSHQLQRSNSLDAVSASGSDGSDERFTPKASRVTPNSFLQDNMSLLSPFSANGTPKNALTSSVDWSGSSVPDGSTDGSTSNSGEGALQGPVQDSDDSVEKLRADIAAMVRKSEVSDLELRTLRKQIMKESNRVKELTKEVAAVKEERDMVMRQYEELQAAQKTFGDAANKKLSSIKDPWSLVSEMKQELSYEKNINSDLRLQLQKTQEANTDLLLAVKELDEMLAQRQKEVSCSKEHLRLSYQDIEYGNELSDLANSEQENQDQLPLAIIVRDDSLNPTTEAQKMIIELSTEIELHKKEREEMEMQMEQLALDYEILKQENHDISTRLEQTQLRETLRMQYECSAHLTTIGELENQVESLERELHIQAEEYEACLAAKITERFEQEQRAIKAEELLRKLRWSNANAAERLQEEFKMLSSQMFSIFKMNEHLLTQARQEASDLRIHNTQLEEMVQKMQEECRALQAEHKVKTQQLLSLVDLKTKEADNLVSELRNITEELSNEKLSDELKLKEVKEETEQLRSKIDVLETEKDHFLQQAEQLKAALANAEHAEASNDILELEELRRLKNEHETIINSLKSEIELKIQIDESLDFKSNIRSCAKTACTNEEKASIWTEECGSRTVDSTEEPSCLCKGSCYQDSAGKNERQIEDRCCREAHALNRRDRMSSCSTEKLRADEVLEELSLLKERNEVMEEELKDLHGRYSEMSLKFAEVEGERQQLVMTVRSLKNSMR